jgi:hypothetical protein
MSEDPSNADAANGGQAGGLLSDPVDVIIDKLLRYVSIISAPSIEVKE